jgi:hypothetical protein
MMRPTINGEEKFLFFARLTYAEQLIRPVVITWRSHVLSLCTLSLAFPKVEPLLYLIKVLVGEKSEKASHKVAAGHELLALNLFRRIFCKDFSQFLR